jgi:hypothetical protein
MSTQKASSPSTPGEQLARSTLTVTGIVVIRVFLGFARDLVIAYTLGGERGGGRVCGGVPHPQHRTQNDCRGHGQHALHTGILPQKE